ncbi:MAG TPA: hypothetical protein VFG83_04735 [Kofleriaceae bacterium]|nr:hypothetical protein [Kofleriaceae bacterium]
MIPYEDLVRALGDWRARNGLATEPAVGLFDAGTADYGALSAPIAGISVPVASTAHVAEVVHGGSDELFVSGDDPGLSDDGFGYDESVDEAAITGEDVDDAFAASIGDDEAGGFAGEDPFAASAAEDLGDPFATGTGDEFVDDPTAQAAIDDVRAAVYVHVAETEVVAAAPAAANPDDDFDEEQAWAAALARANASPDDFDSGTEVGDSFIVDEVPDPDR